MARKTFISYKFSEAQELRNKILESLGDDATYYQGETSDSPDLTDKSTEEIKKNLRNMMYNTSVTIVVISPNIKRSKWIDWELEYCLKRITRKERTSQTNGILGVIQKVKGSYDWFRTIKVQSDGCRCSTFKPLVYDIINKNRYNQNPKVYLCEICQSIDDLTGSYISYVNEEDFLNNTQRYIENAYDKSEKEDNSYCIVREK